MAAFKVMYPERKMAVFVTAVYEAEVWKAVPQSGLARRLRTPHGQKCKTAIVFILSTTHWHAPGPLFCLLNLFKWLGEFLLPRWGHLKITYFLSACSLPTD